MRKVLSNHLIIIFCITLFITSCSKDGDGAVPCSTAYGSDLAGEITAISDALVVYYADESEANCSALKAAYQSYIDALKPYGDCATLAGTQRVEWQKILSDAEADLASICS